MLLDPAVERLFQLSRKGKHIKLILFLSNLRSSRSFCAGWKHSFSLLLHINLISLPLKGKQELYFYLSEMFSLQKGMVKSLCDSLTLCNAPSRETWEFKIHVDHVLVLHRWLRMTPWLSFPAPMPAAPVRPCGAIQGQVLSCDRHMLWHSSANEGLDAASRAILKVEV